MKKELMNQTEAVQASMGGLLAVEQLLQNNYLFRRNVLSGKGAFRRLSLRCVEKLHDDKMG